MNQAAKNKIILIIIFLVLADVFLWRLILFSAAAETPKIYFLDVGQGDSQLLVLPGNVKILIDGGPSGEKLLANLQKTLLPQDRYIDLVIMTHPQTDHFGGLTEAFSRYIIGAFISTGAKGTSKSFSNLQNIINKHDVSEINLTAGDAIKYQNLELRVLSPNLEFLRSRELNDGSLVLLADLAGVKALFTGDIGFKVEEWLVKNYDINADILKVPHHGSKYSSGQGFLKAISPIISIAQVGKNSYGHPTNETLARLAAIGSRFFRNDNDGLIKVEIDSNQGLTVSKEK